VVQTAQLFWTLLWKLHYPDVLLLQNPPCIPTMLVALVVGILRDFRVVVDWHNFGYTVLAMSFASGERHPVVRIAKAYETTWVAVPVVDSASPRQCSSDCEIRGEYKRLFFTIGRQTISDARRHRNRTICLLDSQNSMWTSRTCLARSLQH